MATIESLIELPYNRPGEDLNDNLVEDGEGFVNVKATLQNLIKILKISVNKLEEINKNIPMDNTLDIYGSGDCIGLCGDDEVLLKLINKGLIVEGEFNEEHSIASGQDTDSDTESDSESEKNTEED